MVPLSKLEKGPFLPVEMHCSHLGERLGKSFKGLDFSSISILAGCPCNVQKYNDNPAPPPLLGSFIIYICGSLYCLFFHTFESYRNSHRFFSVNIICVYMAGWSLPPPVNNIPFHEYPAIYWSVILPMDTQVVSSVWLLQKKYPVTMLTFIFYVCVQELLWIKPLEWCCR